MAKGDSPTKVPLREISSSDFKVKFNSKTYQPHKGEHVKVSGFGRMGDAVMVLKLQRLQGLGNDMSPEEAGEAADALEQIFDTLATSIVAWNWTDDLSKPLPEMPTRRDFEKLSPDEVNYLIGKVMGEMPSKESAKNS